MGGKTESVSEVSEGRKHGARSRCAFIGLGGQTRALEHGDVDGFYRGGSGKNQRGLRHGLGLIKRGFGTDWYGGQSRVSTDGYGGVAVSNLRATASGRRRDRAGRARRWGQLALG